MKKGMVSTDFSKCIKFVTIRYICNDFVMLFNIFYEIFFKIRFDLPDKIQ